MTMHLLNQSGYMARWREMREEQGDVVMDRGLVWPLLGIKGADDNVVGGKWAGSGCQERLLTAAWLSWDWPSPCWLSWRQLGLVWLVRTGAALPGLGRSSRAVRPV